MDGYSIPSQIVSSDKGLNFSPTVQEGYEASARLNDGRVMRVDFGGQSSVNLQERRLRVRYSTDNGATFPTTVMATVNIAPQTFVHPTANFFPTSVIQVNPRLSLLPNGILALVAGRPDNQIALSYDGTGNSWNVKKVYYDNHSVASPQDMNEGSSGNADFAWVEANRAVLLADTCHAVTY